MRRRTTMKEAGIKALQYKRNANGAICLKVNYFNGNAIIFEKEAEYEAQRNTAVSKFNTETNC